MLLRDSRLFAQPELTPGARQKHRRSARPQPVPWSTGHVQEPCLLLVQSALSELLGREARCATYLSESPRPGGWKSAGQQVPLRGGNCVSQFPVSRVLSLLLCYSLPGESSDATCVFPFSLSPPTLYGAYNMRSFFVVATLTAAASGASPALGFLASGNGAVRSTNKVSVPGVTSQKRHGAFRLKHTHTPITHSGRLGCTKKRLRRPC